MTIYMFAVHPIYKMPAHEFLFNARQTYLFLHQKQRSFPAAQRGNGENLSQSSHHLIRVDG